MARQSVSITVSVDDKDITVSREVDIEWPEYPEMETLALLYQTYDDARAALAIVPEKAKF